MTCPHYDYDEYFERCDCGAPGWQIHKEYCAGKFRPMPGEPNWNECDTCGLALIEIEAA